MVLKGESEIIICSFIVMQISNALTQARPTDINTVDHYFDNDGGNAGQTPHLQHTNIDASKSH